MNIIEEEKILLQGLANEDKNSIEKIYREHYNMVQSMVINNNGSSDDAADIFQESVIILLEKVRLGNFRGDSSLGTFLQAIARNLWLTELRSRKRRNAREERYQAGEDRMASPTEPVDFNPSGKMNLQRIILQLGDTCQKILRGVYYENRKMRDLLQDFGFANEQVLRNRKAKCMKKLRELFAEDPSLIQDFDIKTLYG